MSDGRFESLFCWMSALETVRRRSIVVHKSAQRKEPGMTKDTLRMKPIKTEKKSSHATNVVSETIERIALEVDYHGLADLYEASAWYSKLFWTVIVIGALGAVIHDCYNIIMLYASNPSATKISEVQVRQLPLPNVTICSMGSFNQTYLRQTLNDSGDSDKESQNDFIRYMMLMAYQKPPGANSLDANVTLPAKGQWDKMIKDVNETIDFLRDTAYQCQQFLRECQFSENPFNCCLNHIFVYTDLGGCYTIRADDREGEFFQTGRDSSAGVSVTIDMDTRDIAVLDEWKSVGLRLQFGDYVSPFDFSSMLYLPPGMLALVRLSPVLYKLDETVTECWQNAPTLTYHDAYSTGLCKHDCALQYTVKVCQCMPYGYSTRHAEQWRTCTIEEMRTCVLPKVWYPENGQDPPELYNCKKEQCRRLCAYWVHEPYLMLSQLREDVLGNKSTKKTNVVNVYFGYMLYTQTEAAPLMTFDTFISNLGGAIGLWTGMSLISVVQMIVYCWEAFWVMMERRKSDKMLKVAIAQQETKTGTHVPICQPIFVQNQQHPAFVNDKSENWPASYTSPIGGVKSPSLTEENVTEKFRRLVRMLSRPDLTKSPDAQPGVFSVTNDVLKTRPVSSPDSEKRTGKLLPWMSKSSPSDVKPGLADDLRSLSDREPKRLAVTFDTSLEQDSKFGVEPAAERVKEIRSEAVVPPSTMTPPEHPKSSRKPAGGHSIADRSPVGVRRGQQQNVPQSHGHSQEPRLIPNIPPSDTNGQAYRRNVAANRSQTVNHRYKRHPLSTARY